MSVTLVANQHTGGIVLPRSGEGGIALPAVRIAPGSVEKLDAKFWAEWKKNQVVQEYLRVGILVEVKSAKVTEVPVGVTETSHPEIPEHLRGADEVGEAQTQKGAAKAGIRKAAVKEIDV